VEQHPAVRNALTREREVQAALRLAQANRMPDLELSAGVRQDNGSDSQGAVVGISVPLPLTNPLTGPIREAEALLEKSRYQAAAGKARLTAEFDAAWTDLANAHDAALTADNQLLPGARQVWAGEAISNSWPPAASWPPLREPHWPPARTTGWLPRRLRPSPANPCPNTRFDPNPP
jgi:hypothetical protein